MQFGIGAQKGKYKSLGGSSPADSYYFWHIPIPAIKNLKTQSSKTKK